MKNNIRIRSGAWHRVTGFFVIIMCALSVLVITPHFASATGSVDVWWPTSGAHVSGTQPFKALVQGMPVEQYDMYWQVDGGQLNQMSNNYTDYPHKEASVDLSGWHWNQSGSYNITFIAKQSGNIIAQQSLTIYIDGQAPAPVVMQQSQQAPAPQPQQSQPQPAQQTTQTTQQTTQTVQQTTQPAQPASVSVQMWWPLDGGTVSGAQPIKAVVQNLSVDQYDMYWQVDGGQLNAMPTNYTDSPHKESSIDFSGWNWKGSGPYAITVVAKKNGAIIGQQTIHISVGSGSSAPQRQTNTSTLASVPVTQSSSPSTNATQVIAGNPISGLNFWVDPNSDAAKQANDWRSSRPSDASAMDVLASQPTATWLGGWNSNITNDVRNVMNAAAGKGQTSVFIAYNIPNRDCGGYSSGGASNSSEYLSWINGLAQGIGSSKAVVVLEPDALSVTSCLSSAQLQDRLSMLASAVHTLKSQTKAVVYLDAGHANWIDAATMSNELKQAGISEADGFALNVSNFTWTNDNITYGTQVSQQVGGKHFVIDTGRNGNGPTSDAQWCNPSGRAIGQKPTTNTGNSLVDAFLWLKTPGESDGNCNGGPNAGVWWPDYALGLVRNAH